MLVYILSKEQVTGEDLTAVWRPMVFIPARGKWVKSQLLRRTATQTILANREQKNPFLFSLGNMGMNAFISGEQLNR